MYYYTEGDKYPRVEAGEPPTKLWDFDTFSGFLLLHYLNIRKMKHDEIYKTQFKKAFGNWISIEKTAELINWTPAEILYQRLVADITIQQYFLLWSFKDDQSEFLRPQTFDQYYPESYAIATTEEPKFVIRTIPIRKTEWEVLQAVAWFPDHPSKKQSFYGLDPTVFCLGQNGFSYELHFSGVPHIDRKSVV